MVILPLVPLCFILVRPLFHHHIHGDILVHMLKTCLPCVFVLCFVFVFGSVYWCQERAPQIVESCNPGLENMK